MVHHITKHLDVSLLKSSSCQAAERIQYLKEIIQYLIDLTEHVVENTITILPPALFALQEIPIADNTAVVAKLTVEIAIPEHEQTDSSTDRD